MNKIFRKITSSIRPIAGSETGRSFNKIINIKDKDAMASPIVETGVKTESKN